MRLIALIVAGGAALIGLVMLAVGLRGRRVDDHPHCRRCGFDLFGKPDAANCPECGRPLASPRSIVTGRRRRRKGLAGGGAALLAAAVLLGGTGAWLALSSVNLQPYKPVWWLTADLSSPAGQDAAIAELSDRLGRDDLSRGQVDGVVARILTIQGDANQKWLMEFGDFVETAWQMERVDDQAFARYVEQGIMLRLTVRPKIRLGDPLPYRKAYQSRMGSVSVQRPRLWLRFEQKHVAIAGHSQKLGGSHGSSLGGSSLGSTSGSVTVEALRDGKIALGPHTCELVGRASVRLGYDGEEIHGWGVTLTDATQVVPRETQTVELIDDEKLRAAVEQSILIEKLRLRRNDDELRINANVEIDPRPAGLAHRVVVVSGERRIEISAINQPADGNVTWSVSTELPEQELLDAEAVDIILDPDIDTAYRTVDVFDLWNRPIVFEDVPVEVEEPR